MALLCRADKIVRRDVQNIPSHGKFRGIFPYKFIDLCARFFRALQNLRAMLRSTRQKMSGHTAHPIKSGQNIGGHCRISGADMRLVIHVIDWSRDIEFVHAHALCSRKSLIKTEIAATIGTAISTPMIPAILKPMSTESKMSSGFAPTVFPITFGTRT